MGASVRVAGMAVVKQRPGTAKGMMFISLEDETGLLDVVVRPDIYERFRQVDPGIGCCVCGRDSAKGERGRSASWSSARSSSTLSRRAGRSQSRRCTAAATIGRLGRQNQSRRIVRGRIDERRDRVRGHFICRVRDKPLQQSLNVFIGRVEPGAMRAFGRMTGMR